MRLIKAVFAFVSIGLFAAPSFAETINKYDWGTINGGFGAGVKYVKFSDKTKRLDAVINHSTSGHQRIYFSNYYNDEKNICSSTTSYPTTATIIFDDQAVKMSRWCKKFNDVDQYYYQYTPETDRGDSYVINLFKRATLPIKIHIDGETLYFPVMGFTKAWNNAGGDAI